MNLKETFRRYMRVLHVARKPSKEEFLTTGKMSALGIFVIGMIGFVIFIAFVLAINPILP
jgi:protein transport protein SEC61 subunit gamma-like protein